MNKISSKRILLVDDEESIVLLFQTIFDIYGYKAHFLMSSENVVSTAIAVKPDLIILDVAMPEKDGYEVCKELRENEFCRDIPIIMITALSLNQDKKRGFECGANAFIFKPFDALLMINEIKRLTEHESR
ncbi:MAG: response regulator [Candidatus Riflebacteria bacterium]|nr:response regulator [Candidatus Riflebacteria bacterium]